MVDRPTGTATFMFSDIEGSTMLWSEHPDEMSAALAKHDTLVRTGIEQHQGYVFSTRGDGFAAAFGRVRDGAAAAIAIQRALDSAEWPDPVTLRVRLGIHTGEAEERDGDYFGPAVNAASRLMDLGHGGQILISGVSADLLEGSTPTRELGTHALPGVPGKMRVLQIVVPELDQSFPDLRVRTPPPSEPAASSKTYAFGDFELDVDDYTLRHRGERVAMEPQVFDVLRHLVTHARRLVTKDQLLDEVWGDRFVSESALTSRIKAVRRAVGDDGRSQHTIKTVHGRGYQFVADVIGPAPESHPTPRAKLPPVPRALVGRKAELDDLIQLIGESRLVTVTGPGGAGKTRLALEAARMVAERGDTDVEFVALSPVVHSDHVANAIATVLGGRSGSGTATKGAIQEAVRGRCLLVVLDNFEHVIEAAPTVADLIEASDQLRCLVTSRERLALAGEQIYRIEQMAEAASLFEQVARSVKPAFELTEHNREAVEAICDLVDRLPLGVELAAAQIRLLPLAGIAAKLRSYFTSLTDRARDRPDRHQTMGRTIAWSVDLLPADEERLLTRLGVFVGGFALETAEAVCGDDAVPDVFGALSSLVDKSLVRTIDDSADIRFSMLHVVRDFASTRLSESGELDEIRRRHAGETADSIARIQKTRWGRLADRWIADVRADYANIRSALEWAFDNDPQLGCGIVGSLHGYWNQQDTADGRRWTERALTHLDTLEPLVQGQVHAATAEIAFGDRDLHRARDHWRQAVEIFESQCDRTHWALALAGTAGTYMAQPDQHDQAMVTLEKSINMARDLGSSVLLGRVLNLKGEMCRMVGDIAEAEAAYQEALGISRRLRDEVQWSVVRGNQIYIEMIKGNHHEALTAGRESLESSWSIGMRITTAWNLWKLALPHQALDMSEKAAILVGAARAALEHYEVTLGPADNPIFEQLLTDLEEQLGADRSTDLIAEGRRMNLAAAVRFALDG